MTTFIHTPRAAIYNKNSAGVSDCVYSNSVYKFMGASVLSINSSCGFNGVASSASVTLVEDIQDNDSFIEPDTPSLWAFSLPKGGLGTEVFPTSGQNLNPNAFNPSNISLYFCGICTGWRRSTRNISGKTINVNLVDPRELLKGVQCLLNGFALSQEIGGTTSRFTGVNNVIDCFGYYNHGLESNANEFGMEWNKIRQAINAIGVTVSGIDFEFTFSGTPFFTPSWYRVGDNVIDLVGLINKVADDAGSDVVCIARKTGTSSCVVEFRAIKRTNTNELSKLEILGFINARDSIVESVELGKEYRNEPTSSIIVGGFKNNNYLALPSSYNSLMHLSNGTVVSYSYTTEDGISLSGVQTFTQGNSGGISDFIADLNDKADGSASTNQFSDQIEDYDKFPPDVVVRLFGGTDIVTNTSPGSSLIQSQSQNFTVEAGSIFPFWGFSPGGGVDSASIPSSFPLIEPFLPLDHLTFSLDTIQTENLVLRIPLVKIEITSKEVRQIDHSDVFLSGDGDSDERPFAHLKRLLNNKVDVKLNSPSVDGWTRGLPLNTEVMRAAMAGEEAFYVLYTLFYPEIAESLDFPTINIEGIVQAVSNNPKLLENVRINDFMYSHKSTQDVLNIIQASEEDGSIPKSDSTLLQLKQAKQRALILEQFRNLIWQHVKRYAEDHIGKRFIVCLPKSNIMNRIWNGQSVPTRIEKPEIEYVVSDKGYWAIIPSEFDGIGGSEDQIDQEKQVRDRFMAEDGRFSAMAIMDWKPRGNASFNSNGRNKAMFQDLPVSDFRPNRIGSGNPDYVFIACSVRQMTRRPDLALVEIPPVDFDPTDARRNFGDFIIPSDIDDEYVATRGGISKYLWYVLKKNQKLRTLFYNAASDVGESAYYYASKVFRKWTNVLYNSYNQLFNLSMENERVMDLKGVVIPLISTWERYGPWYATTSQANGLVRIEVDESLVPWNFERSDPWFTNIDEAGNERLNRSLAVTDYVDSATITVVGFPEFNIAQNLGFNSNITTISVDFDIGGIRTTYNLSTYIARPGTLRKSDFDNISSTLIDTRPKVENPENINFIDSIDFIGTNKFKD